MEQTEFNYGGNKAGREGRRRGRDGERSYRTTEDVLTPASSSPAVTSQSLLNPTRRVQDTFFNQPGENKASDIIPIPSAPRSGGDVSVSSSVRLICNRI